MTETPTAVKTFTKTIDPEADYGAIDKEVKELEALLRKMAGVSIDIGHPHRLWEYGMALAALHQNFPAQLPKRALEVGSGKGLLSAALAYYEDVKVVQVEPNSNLRNDIIKLNEWLVKENKKPVFWQNATLTTWRSVEKFPAVFCISVVEHVENEKKFWLQLGEKVMPGGLLFITADVMTEPEKPHVFDNLRLTNYSMAAIQDRADALIGEGFEHLVEPDWTYRGHHVHDYSFVCVAMKKENNN